MSKLTIKALKERAEAMEAQEAFQWLKGLEEEYGETVKKLADKYYKRMEAVKAEHQRLQAMMSMEYEAYSEGYQFVAGIDEAGRGPLAGPVVAACAILPPGILLHKLNDSKKLSALQREQLFDQIREKALAYGVGIVDHETIDDINIYQATKKAMQLAIENMRIQPDYLIIDAVKLPVPIPQKAVPKADANSVSVAAASILAKVTRDRIMDEMDKVYPEYGFAKHKGYCTEEHMKAIKENGLCAIHRRSFTKNFVQEEVLGGSMQDS
ncbi:MAG: ribonuclease HII [Clostridia bacterium]|nr:ribonuclease HII [Clostridia bacterium]